MNIFKKHTLRLFCIVVSVLTVVSCMNVSAINGYDPYINNLLDGFVYHIKPKNVPTKCIDVLNAYTSDGSQVWLYDMNITAACQEWKFIRDSRDTDQNWIYKIQDCNSGKYLSIVNNSSDNNATVEIRTYSAGNGQLFKIYKNSDGTFRIMTKCSNYTKALYCTYNYSSGGIQYYKLDQYTYYANDNTCRWYIENASNDRFEGGLGIPDGNYLMNNKSNNKVAYNDTDGYAKLKDYSDLDIHPLTRITYQGKGYYTISRGSQYLTANSSTDNNQNVTYAARSATDDKQLWEITYNSTGNYYRIRSKNLVNAGNAYYLSHGGIIVGYKLRQSSSTSSDKWRLIVDELNTGNLLMIGIKDSTSGHTKHSAWMEEAARNYYDNKDNSCKFIYQKDLESSSNSTEITDEITDSQAKVVIFRSHGGTNSTGTYMLLSDNSRSGNKVKLTSEDAASCDFSGAEIILYIGCSTAAGYEDEDCYNLLNQSVDSAGCLMAVGFSDTISCTAANIMAKYFSNYYYYEMNNRWSDYDELTEAEKRYARIDCYEFAIVKAAIRANVVSKCVYYYAGNFNTVASDGGTSE